MRTFAVGAVLAVGVLGGCGGTTEGGPPPSPSTTPSASPSPTAPVMPDAARENTKAGAVAFVKFYISAFNHAQATGDVSTLRSLGAKGCVSCDAVVSAIATAYAKGEHSTGGEWVIEGTDIRPSLAKARAVYVSGRFRPSKTYSSDRATPRSLRGGPIVATFFVKYSSRWAVVRWTRA